MTLSQKIPRTAPTPWLAALASALLLVAAPATQAETARPTKPVSETMHQLARDTRALMPLLYQQTTPTADERALINDRIGSMLAHMEGLAATVAPKADTYRISLDAMAGQLRQSQQAFAAGRDAQGMGLLRSATSLCATCHTQDERPARWLTPTGEGLQDPFVAGEFLFMTRQYDRAFGAYRTWLEQQPTLAYDDRTLTAFSRLLLTALQLRKAPGDISALLGEFARRDNINRGLARDLRDWITGIDDLRERIDIREHPAPDTLEALARDWLGAGEDGDFGRILVPETQRPGIIWLRGELYRALMAERDRTRIADWLYWLALSDRVLEYRLYYSLADMYLKQCMTEYGDDPMAPRCYREYENYILFFYSGSGGTHVPEDIAAEMATLKAGIEARRGGAGQ
ncbi:MAG: hypothetical protein RBR91_11770 [Porticoccaceae bacterium]|jgi:hypothetical protein|nr:hypothetical protein [Porticoccaceae bacterium]